MNSESSTKLTIKLDNICSKIWSKIWFEHLHLNHIDKRTHSILHRMIRIEVMNAEWNSTYNILDARKEFINEI